MPPPWLPPPEQAAQVDFRMQHVFLAFFPAGPEGVLSLESGIQSVVSGADDAVVRIQGGGPTLRYGASDRRAAACASVITYCGMGRRVDEELLFMVGRLEFRQEARLVQVQVGRQGIRGGEGGPGDDVGKRGDSGKSPGEGVLAFWPACRAARCRHPA